MSYIIEQKIRGNIYLYEVESYWDKAKKQARQRRKYLAPKNPKRKQNNPIITKGIIHKNYGNVFLLKKIAEKIGISKILEECFPNDFREILSLSFYKIIQREALYLFPHWLEEHYQPKVKKLDSSGISKLLEKIGNQQNKMDTFKEKWISELKPVNALYYDITSLSSYSGKIDFIENGYNRDKENLAQLNLGMVFCNQNALPINYSVFPGSIVDVTTLNNNVKFLKNYGLKDFCFVLDRGFFSTANILDLEANNLKFIQPLSFSLKRLKTLIKENKRTLKKIENHFLFNNEILSHTKTQIQFKDKCFDAHIFFDEKAELSQRQHFVRILIEIEEKVLRDKKSHSLKEALEFKEENIKKEYSAYYKWNKTTKAIERNPRTINAKLSRFGYFVIATNDYKIEKEEILFNYRNKDQVEKVFDSLKNEINEQRLRVHSQYNADAKLFFNFITLILYSEIINVMRKEKLFKSHTVKEMLFAMKNIKRTTTKEEDIISEISKKQRKIFNAFKIDLEEIPRY